MSIRPSQVSRNRQKSLQGAPKRLAGEILEAPATRDTERAVLGAMFLNQDYYHEAMTAGLKVEDFSVDAHRLIFQCFRDMVESQVPIDIVTIVNYLQGQEWLQRVGDVGYIAGLLDGVPDRPSLGHHTRILKEYTMRRRLLDLGNRAVAQSRDLAEPPKWALSGLQEDALAVIGDAEEKRIYKVGELGSDFLAEIERLRQMHPDQLALGTSLYLRELDDITTGARKGEVVVLGGFPSSGKSAFALNVASWNAGHERKPVLYFSREMSKEQLYARLVTSNSNVPHSNVRRPSQLVRSDIVTLEDSVAQIAGWPFYIDDQASHISEVVARSRLYIQKHKVEMIFVDFVQIFDAPGDKEYDRVSYSADALRDLSKVTGIPVVILSQLTRPEDKRGSKGGVNVKPTMMMLRSSGKLEQNAHIILFTYHPMDEDEKPTGEDLIIVGKQREGVRGRVKAYFNAAQQRWEPRIPDVMPEPKQQPLAMVAAKAAKEKPPQKVYIPKTSSNHEEDF